MDIKNIVLTGASRGIGESIARKLAKNGFNVFGFARNIDRLDSLVKKEMIVYLPIRLMLPSQIKYKKPMRKLKPITGRLMF